MNQQDLQYIQTIKSAINSNTDAVQVIDTLAEIDRPTIDSTNATLQYLIETIDNLEYERNDGLLDVAVEDLDTAEHEIATNNLQTIRRVLTDIDNNNLYHHVFWVEFAYSLLVQNDYDYKLTHLKLDLPIDAALKQLASIKANAPKQHPDDARYTLEDARLHFEIVDINGKTVEAPRFLTN